MDILTTYTCTLPADCPMDCQHMRNIRDSSIHRTVDFPYFTFCSQGTSKLPECPFKIKCDISISIAPIDITQTKQALQSVIQSLELCENEMQKE